VAALELLTTPQISSINNDVISVESLSLAEQARLQEQVDASRQWALGGERNIVGLGVSEKRIMGQITGDLSLVLYIKHKYNNGELESSQAIPPTLEFEGMNEVVPTDVREIGPIELESLTSVVRPILGGYSISSRMETSTGTMGCLVSRRGESNRLFLLSNSHVLAKSGLGQPGDPIYQAGVDDVEIATSNAVATLSSWKPFNFDDGYNNYIDAAIAEITDHSLVTSDIAFIGRPKGIRSAKRGTMVQKTGRTTELTFGLVQDVNFHTSLKYPKPDGTGNGYANFRNLILCSRFTEKGDSGALVLDEEKYAVGLHVCGSSTTSIFCPILTVCDELFVDLVIEN
jgi:hypothetical protein